MLCWGSCPNTLTGVVWGGVSGTRSNPGLNSLEGIEVISGLATNGNTLVPICGLAAKTAELNHKCMVLMVLLQRLS